MPDVSIDVIVLNTYKSFLNHLQQNNISTPSATLLERFDQRLTTALFAWIRLEKKEPQLLGKMLVNAALWYQKNHKFKNFIHALIKYGADKDPVCQIERVQKDEELMALLQPNAPIIEMTAQAEELFFMPSS